MLPVSVCIIAKNEEKYIDECLRRLSRFDFEIIVVDTGSTDRTVEIAKSYTPHVFHFDWVNDFSAARNYSISLAHNDYILVVDCDEYLENASGILETLKNIPHILSPKQIGMIDRFSATADSTGDSLVHESIARIFHKGYIRYEGTIHEQLVPCNGKAPTFVEIPLSFHHVGYSTIDIKRQKALRNITMLEKELTLRQADPYILFQLGQSYFGINDYSNALPYFESALEQDVNEQEEYVQTMVESYGYCLLYLKQYSRALELEGIYSIFSGHADFVFLMGLIYMNNGFFDDAIREFLKATTIYSYSVDGVNSYKAFYNIGIIYECAGDTHTAAEYFKKCGDFAPALERLALCKESEDNTLPILLYRDSGICCNLLNLFIEQLGESLQNQGQPVIYFDPTAEGAQALTKYIGKHFKAIIGVQTYLFALKMQDGTTCLHDLIQGPKYNIILDHPAWMKDEIGIAPQDYYLLLHDRNYIHFANTYYKNIKGSIHFAPAGLHPKSSFIPMKERQYEISFIGSYRDYRERLKVIRLYDRTYRHVAAYYLNRMRLHPDSTGEAAFKDTLKHFGIPHNDERFLEMFYDMKQVYFCILLYYREKIIKTLLDSGLKVHVFSETWMNAPMADHPGLICHPEVDASESLRIMQDSKITLNIMSWHKDGFTERIFNGMLCQSVVLSDTSTALQEFFVDKQDLILFSLKELTNLPSQIKNLLADNQKMQQIAESGYKKALSRHTWQQRASQLLQILDKEE